MYNVFRLLHRIGRKLVCGLSILLFILIIILQFSSRGVMLNDIQEKVEYVPRHFIEYLIIVVTLIVLVLLRYILRYVSERMLFIIGTLFYLIFGMFLILNVDGILRSDPQYVYESAVQLNNGDSSPFIQGGLSHYLSIFPHQTGLVSFFRMYTVISSNPKFIWVCQLCMIVGINFLLWKISDILFSNKLLNKYLIILSYLFLPSLFLTLWAYGDIPGLLFILFSLYWFILFSKNYKKNYFIYSLIFLGLAILVRSNYIIFAITLICYCLLKFLSERKFTYVIQIVSIATIAMSPLPLISAYYKSIENMEVPPSISSLAWVNMGISDNAGTPGYWDGYSTLISVTNGYNEEVVDKKIKSDFNSRISFLKSDPLYTQDFLLRKIKGTWNEPTLQSIYVGPMSERGQKSYTNFLNNLYTNGNIFFYYNIYCSILISIILVLSLMNVIRFTMVNKELYDIQLVPYIYFIGGFLFHIGWETKSRYIYPYMILLLIGAAYVLANFFKKENDGKVIKNRKFDL
ncbi:glycosyltransferase family 39 protein [Streptococcus pluranimalium]|uniref:glycosyltransferase family 39 protein n=1 Tax=Streptococcus pluranimalium TaxID=82348 RepID=UPI00241553F1|nr:glycosyltransferase family 39 protein [Streptococcus pluranimalium]WFM80454.1 glycosyltransferase family 39 protein [Streptococcus pluranimalium]